MAKLTFFVIIPLQTFLLAIWKGYVIVAAERLQKSNLRFNLALSSKLGLGTDFFSSELTQVFAVELKL